jgi:uncharacterized protein YkwD
VRIGVLLVIAASCSGAHPRGGAAPQPPGDRPAAPGDTPDPAPGSAPGSAVDEETHAHHAPAGHGKAAAPSGEAAALLAAHNRVRAKHCAAPLAWSDELAAVAQKWADHLRDAGCAFEHSRTDYGENLAAGTEGTLDADGVVGMWYGEIDKYDFRRGGFSMETGHFTQVVWRATSRVGCGTSQCNGMTIWVCNYDPAGNVEGEYKENVRPRGCK